MPAAEARDNRDEILGEVIEALSRVPATALLPLLPWFGQLARDRGRRLTPGVVRRALGRWRVLQRFAEMRSSPEYRGQSNRKIILRIVGEAPRMFRGVKCSRRSIQEWVRKYNAVMDDGLAGGLFALIDAYGRPPQKRKDSYNGPIGKQGS